MYIQEEGVIIFINMISQVGPEWKRKSRSVDLFIFEFQYKSRADEVFSEIACSCPEL